MIGRGPRPTSRLRPGRPDRSRDGRRRAACSRSATRPSGATWSPATRSCSRSSASGRCVTPVVERPELTSRRRAPNASSGSPQQAGFVAEVESAPGSVAERLEVDPDDLLAEDVGEVVEALAVRDAWPAAIVRSLRVSQPSAGQPLVRSLERRPSRSVPASAVASDDLVDEAEDRPSGSTSQRPEWSAPSVALLGSVDDEALVGGDWRGPQRRGSSRRGRGRRGAVASVRVADTDRAPILAVRRCDRDTPTCDDAAVAAMHAIRIEPMTHADWPDVRRIYAEGIATGDATLEREAPDWDHFDRSHRPTAGSSPATKTRAGPRLGGADRVLGAPRVQRRRMGERLRRRRGPRSRRRSGVARGGHPGVRGGRRLDAAGRRDGRERGQPRAPRTRGLPPRRRPARRSGAPQGAGGVVLLEDRTPPSDRSPSRAIGTAW